MRRLGVLITYFVTSAGLAASADPLPSELGWVRAPAESSQCRGYYQEPLLSLSRLNLKTQDELSITAKTGSLYLAGESHVSGGVTVARRGQLVQANEAYVIRDAKTGRITKIRLKGDVVLREQGKLMRSDSAEIKVGERQGVLTRVLYRINQNDQFKIEGETVRLQGITAWGKAGKISQLNTGVYQIDDGSYSACPPDAAAWQISAKELRLNIKDNVGVAKGAKLKLYSMPVVYLPYITFPVTKARKTGLLFPIFGYLGRSGFNIAAPFYWNIAPNYDATITPSVWSKRGLLMIGNFRYLTKMLSGEVEGRIIPEKNTSDSALGNYARGSVFLHQDAVFTPHWGSAMTFNAISDDKFLQDFSANPFTSTRTQMLQEAETHYDATYWHALLRVQNYETIQPENTIPVTSIYRRLPQLRFDANTPPGFAGLQAGVTGEAVYFNWPVRNNDPAYPDSLRIHLAPNLRWPLHRTWGYLEPRVSVDTRSYTDDRALPGLNEQITQVIPQFSVDSGLYFNRATAWWGKPYNQTLEPRLFYLNVPFRGQSAIPVFDSSYYIFTYDQLFRVNRFAGNDRIGDANQLSLGVTSRWLQSESGFETLSASVGMAFYFDNRKVLLCQPGTDCVESQQIGATSRTAPLSPIATALDYHVSQAWHVSGDLMIDPTNGQFQTIDAGLHYQPSGNNVINLGYSYLRGMETYNQVYTSAAWSLTKRWNVIGTFSYNVAQNFPQSYLAGFEYDSCCWAMRALGGQTFTNLTAANNPHYQPVVYFQVLLKGLGSFGNNEASRLLEGQISGYKDWFK
jgi:LPS-assembly protein